MRHVDALNRVHTIQQVEIDALLERFRTKRSLLTNLYESGLYENYELKRDGLYRFVNGQYLLVVPIAMQKQIVRLIDEKGHLAKVEAIVKPDYAIRMLRHVCDQVIADCVTCILSSRKAGKQEGLSLAGALTYFPHSPSGSYAFYVEKL